MIKEREKILVIDDNPMVRQSVVMSLDPSRYLISEASNATKALGKAKKDEPSLIILNLMMKGKEGLRLCQKLKEDPETRFIPVIVITTKGETKERLQELRVGFDDYLTAPIDSRELKGKVELVLRRAWRDVYSNPLTGLPGNVDIEQEIINRLDGGKKFAVCYLDLDNFRVYNEHYGYKEGDKIIQITSSILNEADRDHGNPDDFLGHLGGDDFVLITTPEKVDRICTEIIKTFDTIIPLYYSKEDRKRGYLTSVDRRNNARQYPLMSISIAVVTNEKRKIANHIMVTEIGKELQRYAKTLPGSKYVKDKREK